MPRHVCGTDRPHMKIFEQDQAAPFKWICNMCREQGEDQTLELVVRDTVNQRRYEILVETQSRIE